MLDRVPIDDMSIGLWDCRPMLPLACSIVPSYIIDDGAFEKLCYIIEKFC